jgi:hypothetical protein
MNLSPRKPITQPLEIVSFKRSIRQHVFRRAKRLIFWTSGYQQTFGGNRIHVEICSNFKRETPKNKQIDKSAKFIYAQT